MSVIYQLNPSDRVLTLGVREAFIYPFTAPSWTDLRLGVFLSLTSASADDSQSGLHESLTFVDEHDHPFIGFKNNSNDTIPLTAGTSFVGVGFHSTAFPSDPCQIWPSDFNLGTYGVTVRDTSGTGTKFWQVFGSDVPRTCVMSGTTYDTGCNDMQAWCFPQTTALAGGYCTFLALRMTKSGSNVSINVRAASPQFYNNIYINSPITDYARSLLRTVAFANSTAVACSPIPDALYFYWPFYSSRLRIHHLVLEKFA